MRTMFTFILALLLASLCAVALHAQAVTKIPFPFAGYSIKATLSGQQDGVLVHGSADTSYLAAPDSGKSEGITVPFVFECDGAGRTGPLYLIPDTGRSEGYAFVGDWIDMPTSVVHDGAGRIMVAWSSQKIRMNDIGDMLFQEATLSLGVFENGVFRLLFRLPGGAHPTLLRDETGTVHLVWERQKPVGVDQSWFDDYTGEVQYASFRNGIALTPAASLGNGVNPSAVLDQAGTVHVLAMRVDSLPSPVYRVEHIAGKGATWGAPDTLATFPATSSFEYIGMTPRWYWWMPSILAFAADRNGMARVLLEQCSDTPTDVFMAVSSNGGSMVIDSTGTRRFDGSTCMIDANGAMSFVFSSRDSLFLGTIDPALTASRSELVAVDSLAWWGNMQLFRSMSHGICLAYSGRGVASQGAPAWLYTRLGTGARTPQPLSDGFGGLVRNASAVSDSSGAIWLAHYRSSSSDERLTWLWRISPGMLNAPRADIPDAFQLHAFPNPATTDATLRFSIPSPQAVTITVHDLLGREVLRVAEGREYSSGTHILPLRIAGFAPSVYTVRMHASRTEAWTTLIVQ